MTPTIEQFLNALGEELAPQMNAAVQGNAGLPTLASPMTLGKHTLEPSAPPYLSAECNPEDLFI